jgi:hypothetical protein
MESTIRRHGESERHWTGYSPQISTAAAQQSTSLRMRLDTHGCVKGQVGSHNEGALSASQPVTRLAGGTPDQTPQLGQCFHWHIGHLFSFTQHRFPLRLPFSETLKARRLFLSDKHYHVVLRYRGLHKSCSSESRRVYLVQSAHVRSAFDASLPQMSSVGGECLTFYMNNLRRCQLTHRRTKQSTIQL